MLNQVRKWVRRQSNPPKVGEDVSGVRPIPQEERFIAQPIYVQDGEVIHRTFINESDMMLWLGRHDYFLRHPDFKAEVQDHMVSHFLTVFTFSPDNGADSGKMRVHTR